MQSSDIVIEPANKRCSFVEWLGYIKFHRYTKEVEIEFTTRNWISKPLFFNVFKKLYIEVSRGRKALITKP